jgi:hypothetical protein
MSADDADGLGRCHREKRLRLEEGHRRVIPYDQEAQRRLRDRALERRFQEFFYSLNIDRDKTDETRAFWQTVWPTFARTLEAPRPCRLLLRVTSACVSQVFTYLNVTDHGSLAQCNKALAVIGRRRESWDFVSLVLTAIYGLHLRFCDWESVPRLLHSMYALEHPLHGGLRALWYMVRVDWDRLQGAFLFDTAMVYFESFQHELAGSVESRTLTDSLIMDRGVTFFLAMCTAWASFSKYVNVPACPDPALWRLNGLLVHTHRQLLWRARHDSRLLPCIRRHARFMLLDTRVVEGMGALGISSKDHLMLPNWKDLLFASKNVDETECFEASGGCLSMFDSRVKNNCFCSSLLHAGVQRLALRGYLLTASTTLQQGKLALVQVHQRIDVDSFPPFGRMPRSHFHSVSEDALRVAYDQGHVASGSALLLEMLKRDSSSDDFSRKDMVQLANALIASGNTEAMYRFASDLRDLPRTPTNADFDRSFELLTRAAVIGHTNSLRRLGRIHELGKLPLRAPDVVAALRFYDQGSKAQDKMLENEGNTSCRQSAAALRFRLQIGDNQVAAIVPHP